MNKNLASLLTILINLLILQIATAKEVILYEQPKDDAKIISNIYSESGIIPIYSPKDSEWIKVADPKNGNVGWMKSSEFNSAGNSVVNVRIVNSGTKSQGLQVTQFGNHSQLTQEQADKLFKQMQAHHQQLEKDMQLMMQDMLGNDNSMWPTFPVILPWIMTSPATKQNVNLPNAQTSSQANPSNQQSVSVQKITVKTNSPAKSDNFVQANAAKKETKSSS